MKILYAIIIFCWGMFPLIAQEQVEIFGYFESTMMGTLLDNDLVQLNTNKLRLDLKSSLSDDIIVVANFDYINYNGQLKWNILEFLSSDIASRVPEDEKMYYTIPFSDRNSLDNAYIKFAFDRFDLTIGKQQIPLGTGYVWNPTDIFSIKDPLDPTYEQPGFNAARFDIPLGINYTFTTIYSPEDTWANSGKLVKFKGHICHFDYTFIAVEKKWVYHDYTRFDTDEMNFHELPEKRKLLGVSTAGELLGVGTWVEYGYNFMETFKDFEELVVGFDYTFDFQTYIMAEYYRNSMGKTDFKKYDLNDWMRQFTSEQKSISRDQFYLLIQHPVSDFITLGSSLIMSISDNSIALVPTLNYSMAQNVDITGYLNYNVGKEGTAFSEKSGSGGMLRATVYF